MEASYRQLDMQVWSKEERSGPVTDHQHIYGNWNKGSKWDCSGILFKLANGAWKIPTINAKGEEKSSGIKSVNRRSEMWWKPQELFWKTNALMLLSGQEC